MRYSLIIFFYAVFMNTVQAQVNYKEIPKKVVTRFTELYPDVNMAGVDWDKEENTFEANFSEEGKKNRAIFDAHGNWISSEVKNVTLQELPQNIINALYFSDFSDWKTDDIHVMMNSKEILYEIEVKKGLSGKKNYFDKDGNQTDKESL